MTGGEEAVSAARAGDPDLTYGGYLGLEQILSAQHPRSDAHDELLFIVQHQTSELWIQLLLHELDAAVSAIAADEVRLAAKMLARVSRIFEQLNSSWDVLRTLTPVEYLTFRDDLGGSSGFQSHQYRAVEFVLGNKDARMLAPHRDTPAVQAALEARLRAPDLYDVVLAMLARQGLDVPADVTHRDLSQPHELDERLIALWRTVYGDPAAHWAAYELAEKLVDLEDYFRRWRFNHVTTVARIIGTKPGTGGTSGVDYLRRRLDVVLFADLWAVRSSL